MRKLAPLLALFTLTSCAYMHNPTASNVTNPKQYASDLSQCQDIAQPSFADGLLYGLSPVASGAVNGSDSLQLRVDNCLRKRGYDVKTNWLYRNM